jgi:hypothetical protein
LAGSIGWVARDEAVRRTETEQVVAAALADSTAWQEKRRVPEALSAARRADGLVKGGTADDALRRRVQARLGDLELLATLEDIRLEGSAGVNKDNHYDFDIADRRYAEAFREFGIDVENLRPEEAGARIRQMTVAVEVAGGLRTRVGSICCGSRGWPTPMKSATDCVRRWNAKIGKH